MPVTRFPLLNPNSKAATSPPTAPVIPPIAGPPNNAAMKVVKWLMSSARLTCIGPTGMFGAKAPTCVVIMDSMFPRAAIMAMNVMFLVVSFAISLEDIY